MAHTNSKTLDDIPEDIRWLYLDRFEASEKSPPASEDEVDGAIKISELSGDLRVVEADVIFADEARSGLTVNCSTLVALSENALASLCRDSHYETLWLCGSLRQARPIEMRPDRLLPEPRQAAPKFGSPTPEAHGFTNWHLLAMGILPPRAAKNFLETALEESAATLRADLWELSGQAPDWSMFKRIYDPVADWVGWPDDILTKLTRFRTPLELSTLSGQPLLAPYQKHLEPRLMSEALQELMAWSEQLQNRLERVQAPKHSSKKELNHEK